MAFQKSDPKAKKLPAFKFMKGKLGPLSLKGRQTKSRELMYDICSFKTCVAVGISSAKSIPKFDQFIQINLCQDFATRKNLKFSTNENAEKSKTKCIFFFKKAKDRLDILPALLNGNALLWVSQVKHLGNLLYSLAESEERKVYRTLIYYIKYQIFSVRLKVMIIICLIEEEEKEEIGGGSNI